MDVYKILKRRDPDNGSPPQIVERVYADSQEDVDKYVELRYGEFYRYNDCKIWGELETLKEISSEYLIELADEVVRYKELKVEIAVLGKQIFYTEE